MVKFNPLKAIKKSINKFLQDVEKANKKQFGTGEPLDCCKLNKEKKN